MTPNPYAGINASPYAGIQKSNASPYAGINASVRLTRMAQERLKQKPSTNGPFDYRLSDYPTKKK